MLKGLCMADIHLKWYMNQISNPSKGQMKKFQKESSFGVDFLSLISGGSKGERANTHPPLTLGLSLAPRPFKNFVSVSHRREMVMAAA